LARIKVVDIVIAIVSLAIIWIIVVHGIAFERKPGSFSRKDAKQFIYLSSFLIAFGAT
jgi:hypothetical protein